MRIQLFEQVKHTLSQQKGQHILLFSQKQNIQYSIYLCPEDWGIETELETQQQQQQQQQE